MKKKLIGAIRWDAWVGTQNKVGLEVEKTLSHPRYHNRLPFYAKIHNDNIKIRCTTEDIINEEITYAYNYGIDYFAFCWYPFYSGLDIARTLFLSIKQNKVKWCLILGTNPFTEKDADWLIQEFKTNNYLKIDNRPVVYLFNVNSELISIVNYIKNKALEINPYFIGLVWDYNQAIKANSLIPLDALSQYCTPGKNNMEYQKLSVIERNKWHEYLSINKVIPWVTTGWDKRPRYDNPVSWENCQKFNQEYIQFPTIEELKKQLENAITFADQNQSSSILIYAWNEFDEGGFIEPTLKDNIVNLEKLEAIKDTIDKMCKM